MLKTTGSLTLATLTAVALIACSNDEPTGLASGDNDQSVLSQAEAEELAFQMDVSAASVIDGQVSTQEVGLRSVDREPLASFPPGMGGDGTLEIQFTHTWTCAFGGEVTTEGTMLRTWEWESRHLTIDFSAVRTHRDCVFPVRDLTITLRGNPNVVITAHRERQMGGPLGLQTMSHVGSIDWEKSDGTSGTCEIDFHATLDPEAHTRTVEGTACGWSFRRVWTWRWADGGTG